MGIVFLLISGNYLLNQDFELGERMVAIRELDWICHFACID